MEAPCACAGPICNGHAVPVNTTAMKISQIALRLGQSLLRITGALATVLGLLLAAVLAVTTMPGSSCCQKALTRKRPSASRWMA